MRLALVVVVLPAAGCVSDGSGGGDAPPAGTARPTSSATPGLEQPSSPTPNDVVPNRTPGKPTALVTTSETQRG